jgi:uncharacterized membrane protein (UPF0136 family)
MSLSAIAAILYGILSLLGGILGYAKAQSKPSLISGTISGVLLIISGLAITQGAAWGWWFALILTFVLESVFFWRLIKTRKFMPAGLMVIAGIATLIIIAAN